MQSRTVVTRGFDNAGRFTSVQDWLSNTTTFGYDVNSNLTTETLPAAAGVVDTFTFDAGDRLMGIADKKGKTSLFAATYTRDNANQLASDSTQPSSTKAYKYTTLNQVCYAGSASTSACASPPSGSLPYKYDTADNLTQIGTTQQALNNADELCWTASTSGTCAVPPSGATTYLYDTRGNRTKVTPASGGATTLSYDQANRLTAFGTSATYAYNGGGLRMSRTVSATTSQYAWDLAGSVPLLLKDGAINYIFGPGAEPLEQVNGSTALWLHHDQVGSTRLVTSSSGSNVASYTFDPYGNLTSSTGTIANPLRFGGQYLDTESGFYYLRARYYDPATGQFISRDPEMTSTRQPYAYVYGNPVNSTDPSGLCSVGPIGLPFGGSGNCINSAGVGASASTEAGLFSKGGAGSLGAGVGYFGGSGKLGGFGSAGGFYGGPGQGAAAPSCADGSTPVGGNHFALGAEVEAGPNVWISNARHASDLEGNASVFNFNLQAPFVRGISAQLSVAKSGIWQASLGIPGVAGPNMGLGASAYDTSTKSIGDRFP